MNLLKFLRRDIVKNKVKIPYKLFFVVLSIVTLLTFLILNFNPVPITFIFFTIKVPLTILFILLIILGAIIASIYWKSKYKQIKLKLERTEKLLFKTTVDTEIKAGDIHGDKI